MKLRELFTDESKWNKERYAVDAYGISVDPLNTRYTPVKFCLMGGINYCYRDAADRKRVCEEIKATIDPASPHTTNYIIIGWNDDLNRTFADVKGLVNKLDI